VPRLGSKPDNMARTSLLSLLACLLACSPCLNMSSQDAWTEAELACSPCRRPSTAESVDPWTEDELGSWACTAKQAQASKWPRAAQTLRGSSSSCLALPGANQKRYKSSISRPAIAASCSEGDPWQSLGELFGTPDAQQEEWCSSPWRPLSISQPLGVAGTTQVFKLCCNFWKSIATVRSADSIWFLHASTDNPTVVCFLYGHGNQESSLPSLSRLAKSHCTHSRQAAPCRPSLLLLHVARHNVKLSLPGHGCLALHGAGAVGLILDCSNQQIWHQVALFKLGCKHVQLICLSDAQLGLACT